MSVCTFLASDYPLMEVRPEEDDDNFFLLIFENIGDYTDKKLADNEQLGNVTLSCVIVKSKWWDISKG